MTYCKPETKFGQKMHLCVSCPRSLLNVFILSCMSNKSVPNVVTYYT